ncbi:hypothetical protein [Microtetraspora sp. NBRC 16547]|nr:hypothetical protein [Microtetraspora sp. NBRC 16547]
MKRKVGYSWRLREIMAQNGMFAPNSSRSSPTAASVSRPPKFTGSSPAPP